MTESPSNEKELASFRASVVRYWGSKNSDTSSAYNFYGSYLEFKKKKEDWRAMKMAAQEREWIHSFATKALKKRVGKK